MEPASFQKRLLDAVPHLRAYARTLTRHKDRADDLVQETLLAAWENRDSLRDIEKLKPWLLTILRNAFCHSVRLSKRELSDSDGQHIDLRAVAPSQIVTMDVRDVLAGLDTLAPDQREALVLICVQQLSYEEAAAVAGCPVGTLKSRLNRGREKLLSYLQWDQEGCGDDLVSAALSSLQHARAHASYSHT